MHPMVLKNLLMVLTLSDLHSSILFHPANEDKLIPESIYDTIVFSSDIDLRQCPNWLTKVRAVYIVHKYYI